MGEHPKLITEIPAAKTLCRNRKYVHEKGRAVQSRIPVIEHKLASQIRIEKEAYVLAALQHICTGDARIRVTTKTYTSKVKRKRLQMVAVLCS